MRYVSALTIALVLSVLTVFGQDSTLSYKDFEIDGLNSSRHDLCPVMHKGKVVFASSRSLDHVSLHRTPEGTGFLKLFSAKLKYDLGVISGSSNPVLAAPTFLSDRHDGPACFSKDGKTVWFTQEVISAEKNNEPVLVILSSDWRNEKWTKPEVLSFCESTSSYAHPAVSTDGRTIWFSSDRKGSRGGMDLWYSEKKPDGWSEPVNAGDRVNTTENDVFPSFHTTDLYFSSKGHGSMGGYDLFKVRTLEDPMVERLPQPINSIKDDFGICFINERHGLFTSNRPEGEGGDDIYGFMVSRADEELVSIIGRLKQNGVPLPGVDLALLEERTGQMIRRAVTDEDGKFRFDGLVKNERYILQVDRGDAVDLLNENGDVIGAMIKGPNGFVFTALPFDEMDQLTLIDEGDPSLLSLEIEGQVFRKVLGDVQDTMNVQVLDSLGRIHYATTTRDSGKFTFERVPPYDEYRFRLDPTPDSVRVRVFDPQGPIDIFPEEWSELFSYDRTGENSISITSQNGEELHVRMDEKYRIPLVYYELDKWELDDKGKEDLKRVAALLLINEHIKAELSSHTDSRGTVEYNQDLSEKRAKAAVDYLKLLGVPEDAISSKGYGESKLISDCADEVPCTEQEYARDRRTELRIAPR